MNWKTPYKSTAVCGFCSKNYRQKCCQVPKNDNYESRCTHVRIMRLVGSLFVQRRCINWVRNHMWGCLYLLTIIYSYLLAISWQRQAVANLNGYTKSQGKAFPLQAWTGPWSCQKLMAPRFQNNRQMKAVRLSALRTGRLWPPRKYSWYSLLLEAESTPGP